MGQVRQKERRQNMARATKDEQVFTNCTVGGPLLVYVRNGKITRVEPLELSADDAESWVIRARGRKFSPARMAKVANYALAERSRIYSPDRLLYPLKRVDFNPRGDRKAENRGTSGYKRISWDEALDILAKEIERIQKTYTRTTIRIAGRAGTGGPCICGVLPGDWAFHRNMTSWKMP
jgi:anaerobic selenocysteine-containing dehydrogenase